MISLLFASFLGMIGCESEKSSSGKKEDSKSEQVEEKLKNPETVQLLEKAYSSSRQKDLPKMAEHYEAAVKVDPSDVEAATGAAYSAMLKGDFDAADAYLAAVQDQAGSKKSEILLRRSIIAIRKLDFEKAKEYALSSETDMGKLFAAEFNMIDDENEVAINLLEEINDSDLQKLKNQYLRYLSNDNIQLTTIAASQAMWAMGEKQIALSSIEKSLVNIDFPEKDSLILVWAGRALSIGSSDKANNLINATSDKDNWRFKATKAIVDCATKTSKCRKVFSSLEKTDIPPQAFMDAKVTAANLIADDDPKNAKKLLENAEGNSAARVLSKLGKKDEALEKAEGAYSSYLEGK